MQWMKENGTTVYISLTPKMLVKRLENGINERPVLKGLKGAELEEFIAEKLSEREDFYNQAELVVSGVDLYADGMMKILEEHYRK
jgi:shikimate kinase